MAISVGAALGAGGCAAAIAGAPFARVYLDLKPDAADVFA
jgi:hypothetical protein